MGINVNNCYIIKEWFFNFNHFSLIIFYHSVWLGIELFGLSVQVCSQLVLFTLARKGYDNHHCHNTHLTRQEMGLECRWHHAQKRWAENLEDFEKDSVEVRPWSWEVEVRPWCWEVGVRPWCWEVGVRPCSWGVDIGPCRQTIEFLPLEHRELSSLPLRRRLGLAGPDQRRWIEI